jgi:hypothetical protein
VGTPIVECEYLPFVPAKQHGTIGSGHRHHLLFFQVGERRGTKESCKIGRNARGSHNQEDNRLSSDGNDAEKIGPQIAENSSIIEDSTCGLQPAS